jgi:hypothetical protein
MNNFTIDNETNNITFHTEPVEDANSERFSSSEQLVALAASWPTSRLIDIWNSLPGVTPVTKFKDRKTATTRIWNAIQVLGEPAVEGATAEAEAAEAVSLAEEVAQEVTEEAEATIETVAAIEAIEEPANETPACEPEPTVDTQTLNVEPETVAPTTKATRQKKAATGETKAPREGSKTNQVITMLKREGGTTLEEIMTAMGWQKHTTRAMLSAGGSLTKNHRLVVTSEMVGDKRTYSIKA